LCKGLFLPKAPAGWSGSQTARLSNSWSRFRSLQWLSRDSVCEATA